MRKFNKMSVINQFLNESIKMDREIKLRTNKQLTFVNNKPEARFRVMRNSVKKEIQSKIKF